MEQKRSVKKAMTLYEEDPTFRQVVALLKAVSGRYDLQTLYSAVDLAFSKAFLDDLRK